MLALAPLIGLFADTLTQIASCHLTRRPALSIALGALAGLGVTGAVIGSTRSLAGWPGGAVALMTYAALAFGFWAFLNLNLTSLRIRLLREALHQPVGMPLEEILRRYSSDETLARRLERLKKNGQLAHSSGRWYLNRSSFLIIARILEGTRALLIPRAAEPFEVDLNRAGK